jgi:hypothetical protein
MTDKTYLVRFKPRELGLKAVIAARAEIHGEHIALLNSKGKLAALFLVEIVESWSVLGNPAPVAGFGGLCPFLCPPHE